MNPWWLKPPADEEPAKSKKAKEPARKTQEEQESEKPEKKAASGQRRSSRSRGGKRRRSPAGKGQSTTSRQRQVALFVDAEGVGAALETEDGVGLDPLLSQLAIRGRVIAKRVYGDWGGDAERKEKLEAAGLEIVELPPGRSTDPRSIGIKLSIDAVELCLSDEPCDIFAIATESGDFSNLVEKLQESKAQVLGIGSRESVAEELLAMCDEFLFFDELVQSPAPAPARVEVEEKKQPIFEVLVETIQSLEPDSEGVIWGSSLKQAMRRRVPELDITELGYSTFTDLLEDAERHEVIHLERDDRSGSYYVKGLAGQ